MLLARIVGTVVATRKDPKLEGHKLLVARGMDPQGKPEGNYLVAVDTVDAGVGETVLIVRPKTVPFDKSVRLAHHRVRTG